MSCDWVYAYRIDRGVPAPLPVELAERVAIADELVTVYGWGRTAAADACGIGTRHLVVA